MQSIATTYPADRRAVEYLLNQPIDGCDGRSEWVWVHLANGDTMLGFYPTGEAYARTEEYWADSDRVQEHAKVLLAEDEDTIYDPEPWVLYVDGVNTGVRFAEKHPNPVAPIGYRYEPRKDQ